VSDAVTSSRLKAERFGVNGDLGSGRGSHHLQQCVDLHSDVVDCGPVIEEPRPLAEFLLTKVAADHDFGSSREPAPQSSAGTLPALAGISIPEPPFSSFV
jgi:hypothetical protein